ncbi:MAG TPA: response regulator transcription factor [Vicinamibacterales bacterium]|nr:response regulator transcription factor [Vicinamibacterales bacterium]
MSRISIVEDDRDIADLIRLSLQKAGHTTEVLSSGDGVVARLKGAPPDLIVLDLMLPGADGFDICRALRSDTATAATPIIVVSARAEESDRIRGLELGADDYVTKPFSPKELVARVAAVQRRVAPRAEERVLRYRTMTIDTDRHVVSDEGVEVALTAKEFLLLEYLVRHRGRVVSRERLLTDVWGYQYVGGTRTVDVHVRRLRKKLPLIEASLATIHQFGYKLLDPES